jgi:predicted ATP-binding protein involved in virulence
MPVKNLEISMLGPFEEISFEFNDRVNVFIGPNNCGKSTVLMGLAEAIIFPFGVPQRLYRSEGKPKISVSTNSGSRITSRELPWTIRSNIVAVMRELGYTGFVPALRENTGFRPKSPMGSGTVEPRNVRIREGNRIVNRSYENIVYPREDLGKDIDVRLELEPTYERLKTASKEQKSDLTKEDNEELERRRTWSSDPSRITDQAVVSKIVELDYRAYRKNDVRFREVISIVANIASEIMSGFAVTFECIEENKRGLFPQFATPDGPLSLDKLSQGTQSIIQWISHLVLGMAEYYDFPEDLKDRKAVFIIDEIDAHMHPEWQRRIIKTLTNNLPNCQLFVSTHSPLILSGLKEGQVQLLNRDNNNKVVVTVNESDTVAWSVDEIMRCLMGMRGTFDVETENMVDKLGEFREKGRLKRGEKEELEKIKKKVGERLTKK